jgi:hypothetical protein
MAYLIYVPDGEIGHCNTQAKNCVWRYVQINESCNWAWKFRRETVVISSLRNVYCYPEGGPTYTLAPKCYNDG